MFERMSRRGARIGRRGEKKGGAPLQRSVWLHLQLRWLLFEIMQLRLGYLGMQGQVVQPFHIWFCLFRAFEKKINQQKERRKFVPREMLVKGLPAVTKVGERFTSKFVYQQ